MSKSEWDKAVKNTDVATVVDKIEANKIDDVKLEFLERK